MGGNPYRSQCPKSVYLSETPVITALCAFPVTNLAHSMLQVVGVPCLELLARSPASFSPHSLENPNYGVVVPVTRKRLFSQRRTGSS